jgi:long-subunit acyl-CoA synthetase (AMP-forming)
MCPHRLSVLIDWYSLLLQEYIVLMHSLLAITTPFAPISSDIPFELNHLIKSSKCTRLFVHAQLLHKVLPVANNAGIPRSRIYILEGMAQGWKSLSELIDNARTKNIVPVSIRPAAKETLAYLIFSSGTTGLPKGWIRSC